MEPKDKIILIGAGNVAYNLATALVRNGENLCQIYSRTIESARALGIKTGISYTTEIHEIYPDGDIYIFCVSDDILPSLIKKVRYNPDSLLIHTTGSVSIDVFKNTTKSYGVIYPLQTFSKGRELDFREIPLCVEANNSKVLKRIKSFAGVLSDKVYDIDSEKRKCLHIAAVFACNFTNYMYSLGAGILEDKDLSFSMLRPLIDETAHKVMVMNPYDAQTGPARRGDETIMGLHKTLLRDKKELLKIYSILSDGIKEQYEKSENNEEKMNKQIDDNSPGLW